MTSSRAITATISIHSLRVEGDQIYVVLQVLMIISIHSLRVEGDRKLQKIRLDVQ